MMCLCSCAKSEEVKPGTTRYANKSVEEIVSSLTLEQKAAQMVQPQIASLPHEKMRSNDYGSILSKEKSLNYLTWQKAVDKYQDMALDSEAGIPYIYGQDDVHGVNYAVNTVIFPHNIGMGAANDPALMYEVGLATADEAKLCHMLWNFAPVVAQSVDPRWGRTYETYGSDLEIIKSLSSAYTQGLIDGGVVACGKHFFADGNVLYGTGENSDVNRIIDRGDAVLTDEEIKELLDVYQELVDTGIQTIMLSHSSLNGVKMHENKKYIDYLKNEMGFEGLVLSDWNSIQNTSGKTYKDQVINCVNAGVDMLMEVDKYDTAMDYIIEAVNENKISMERVDDAVTRIIKVKKDAGLFEDPYLLNMETRQSKTGSEEYRLLAEKCVEESLVLVKNDNNVLPLKEGSKIFVYGPALNNARVQCGGWTIDWTGPTGDKIDGVTTILDGLKEVCKEKNITIIRDVNKVDEADVILLFVGEEPYAEWTGDTEDLDLCGMRGIFKNDEAIRFVKKFDKPVVSCIVAGRNVIIEDYKNDWDSIVMCYLPGSEGKGVANVLCGLSDFKGKLPCPWYSSVDEIRTDKCWLEKGFGLTYEH